MMYITHPAAKRAFDLLKAQRGSIDTEFGDGWNGGVWTTKRHVT